MSRNPGIHHKPLLVLVVLKVSVPGDPGDSEYVPNVAVERHDTD